MKKKTGNDEHTQGFLLVDYIKNRNLNKNLTKHKGKNGDVIISLKN